MGWKEKHKEPEMAPWHDVSVLQSAPFPVWTSWIPAYIFETTEDTSIGEKSTSSMLREMEHAHKAANKGFVEIHYELHQLEDEVIG